MLFNSLDFALFLPIVFVLYWFVANKNLKLQNFLIVVASYYFYGCWDWRFLSLIVFSTLVDYSIGVRLSKENNLVRRKVLLWTSILVNLGFLGFFKYYNFFLENFIASFSLFGLDFHANTLNIILPVGISFYTFQTLSYTIDVYRRKLEPTKDVIAFAAFVSFFPQLVAGPIERATHLLPQILNKRKFNSLKAIEGIKFIIYGFFLKIFIADTLAPVVDEIFSNYESVSGGTLMLGAIFFSIQIYGDFSGYSKIARGVSKLFGFELMENFDFPYFSRSIGEFWRKWHISLNTWFRDYLYIPLGGSRLSKYRSVLNVFIIFLVSGFWHGANWTFIAWGFIHASLFIPSFILGTNRKHVDSLELKSMGFIELSSIFQIMITYLVVTFAWIFFRSENITQALYIVKHINFEFDSFHNFLWVIFICILFDFLLMQRKYEKFIYPLMVGAIIAASFSSSKSEFIYFQF
ncbi:MBOAT family O-acyltransferase [Mangrovimonas aestuarii]|uniref:MBOAT family O-acyltransferase n=1 Tax=Mangrovimonas aestuarii TaxID=3018443 RepID=UPI002377E051|nr:MBOAT family O-acyltransferase [Mangrovimonas aestuarii]